MEQASSGYAGAGRAGGGPEPESVYETGGRADVPREPHPVHETSGQQDVRPEPLSVHENGGQPATAASVQASSPLALRLWPATARSVRRARRELVATLAAWELEELTDVAGLVLSELMTNSVQHGRVAGRKVGTHFIRRPDGVRIEVHDAKDGKPEVRAAGSYDEHGRGLALVDALTGSRWGVTERCGPGKLVWAECRLDGERM